MPAYVGNPLAGDPICEASSASELRIAITTKQVSRAGHPSDLLVARSRTPFGHPRGTGDEAASRCPVLALAKMQAPEFRSAGVPAADEEQKPGRAAGPDITAICEPVGAD